MNHSKVTLNDLALSGNKPMFSEKLHVGRPNIGDRDKLFARLEAMLDRRWLTNHGPIVKEFEGTVAELLNVKHAISVCNATIGLEIAINALGLEGEVIVPSFTFIATAHAIRRQNIVPIFCDIDPVTQNIDPNKIEALITPRTTGIVGVHLWGRPCDIDDISIIAERYNLKVLYDAAHAFNCSYHGEMLGNFGNAEVFSFHATKFLNAFEGGMVTTNDDEIARKVRSLSNFGYSAQDHIEYAGTNGKMSEISAAMGLTGLESMDSFIQTNHQNYLQYKNGLQDILGIHLIDYDPKEKNNCQYIVVEVDKNITNLSRDSLHTILTAENVLARKYFSPGCHRAEPYLTEQPDAGNHLPITEILSDNVLAFPNGTAVSQQEINGICQLIRFSIQHAQAINELIATKQSI